MRALLLCVGTVLSFHIPISIDCPNSDIHVYINQTAVDRSEYTFVDWNAANLQDCIEKCFGNHFCYSIRFDSSLDHNCGLYYFAAYNCSNQALTKASAIDYKGGSITLDCIRCPGRGDFVTAPPFSSIGEQTIVSETAVLARGKNIKGTATEITHNSENEGKTHGEIEGDTSKGQSNDEGKKTEEGKEGEKGAIEGSGEEHAEGSPSGIDKTGEESTLTGTNPSSESATSSDGSTAVPSAESSDATTANPEEEEAAGSTAVPSEAGSGGESVTGAAAAPTEGAAPSTEEPGSESASTPSRAESDEESSTVEGSGEEATSPLTGPNGETETIEESSGEGVPSAAESASKAPGIMPTDSDVEGSGVEGSGVGSPEIGLQEEEEAVKVEVETTTAWNGHTEQPRECSGSLRFVPSSIVDLDTVQLLINSTKANSPAECAKICYEHNCGFAYYEPSTFICQFMANTEDMVDSTTCPSDFTDSKYQAEFRTDVASTLTCVVCAKESQVDNSKPALQPVASPRRGSYPACIISFQAAEGDHSSFPFYKSVQVKGLNECARHCFIGECSQSVYNPKTKECRLGSNPRDTCNNFPLIQKFASSSEEVLLQCFRCIPEDLIGVKGTVSETTGYREPPSAAESVDEAAATANKAMETAAAAAVTTTTEPTTEAATEASTEAATEASTEAATEASTEAATEASTEAATEASTEAATTESATEETTTIAGSGDEVELTEPLPEGVTETPEEETTIAIERTTTEEETTPIGGEEVELEEASGQEETSTSAGVIKTTPSGYGSDEEGEEKATTAVTAEGSGEEEAATSKSPESGANQDYEATTAAGAAEKEEGVGAATTAASEETTTGAEEETTGEGEATTAGGEEGATTAAGEEETTAAGAAEGEETTAAGAAEGEETTAAGAAEGEETTTVVGEEGVTTAAGEEGASTLSPEEAATTEAGAETSSLSPEEAATSEGPGEMSKAIEANDKPLILASEDLDFGKSCVIKFQSALFASRPASLTAQFEKSFPVDSIELCATRCFQDGCTSAKYEPETKTCHLAYDDKPICDRSELQLRVKEVTGETWIHCVNCYPEKSEANKILGTALNQTKSEEEKEDAKESMLDKVIGAVSDVAHSVAETVTGEKPDTVLKHGCIVNFQTSPSSEMADKVEFLPPFKTRYAHRCATKCFQEGCAAARFDPTTNECSLGYGRFVKCSNSPLVTTALDVKETVTIHCMSCIHHKPGEGGIDLVVLSPDDARIHVSESQDVPAEEVEGSGTEEATVSPVAGGESTTEGVEATTASTGEASTVSSEEGTTASGAEGASTEAGAEEGSTVSGGEEGTTVSGAEGSSTEAGTEEGSTVSGAEEGSTAAGETSSTEGTVGEGSTAAPSTVTAESTVEEPSTVSSTEGSGELNGGSLGEEGSGPLEGPGTGRISEVPLETGADGVQIPAGVNLDSGEAEGKAEVDGEKSEEGKFKPSLPAGFNIDSGLGRVQVDGKMPETGGEGGKKEGTGAGEKGPTTGTAGTGEGEKPLEAKTGAGTEAGIGAKEGAGLETGAEGGESSSASPSESSAAAEGTESSTGLTTEEEEGEATTASTDESSSSATPSDSSTAVGETSTPGEEASSTVGHELIHPAKEFEHTPLHPEGEEVELESAESTTAKEVEGVTTSSKDSESTTAGEEGVTSSAKDAEATTAGEEGVTSSSKDYEATTSGVEGVTSPTKGVEATTAGEEGVTSSSKVSESTTAGEEGVTSSSKDFEATTSGAETTTEEEGPAFVQESPSEDEAKEEGLAIANDDQKHRDGLLEKTLANATLKNPTGSGESTPGATVSAEKPSAAESIDSSLSTTAPVDEEAAGKSTVAPVESSTPATEESTSEASTSSWTGSTEGGEIDAMAAMDATASQATTEEGTTTPSIDTATGSESTTAASEVTTGAVSDEASTTAATVDLQHKEGILEKSLAAANPEITTKEGEKGSIPVEATTPAAESGEGSSSTVEPALESTIAPSTEAPEGAESTVASSTEGGETTVATEGSSSVAPVDGMAASVDEKTKEEPKEVEEEMAQKGEVKMNGEKGVAAASLDTATSTVAPSESSSSTSAPLSTTAVPSPADLAKIQHHEKGGAEFGQTGQKGTEETAEELAHKGHASSLDASTVAPSDAEGAASTPESDAATGELTTSSSIEGGVGGLARGETTESTTSSAEVTTNESSTVAAESSTRVSEGSSTTVESLGGGEESSTPSSEGAESSTATASESTDTPSSIDSESLIQKALATGSPKITEKTGEEAIPTTAVPSPADLAKIQHHEKGGAEFGQTGRRGSEGVGAQEDEIKSTSISPVEGSTSVSGESLDGGIDRALTAIGEETKTTTEPPVQAVKDLLDALASGDFDRALLGKKPNGTEAEALLKGKTQITEVATPINQKHEGQTFFEHDHTVDITTLHAIDDSILTVPSPQGVSKDCDGGRLEFQFVPAGSLPRLNVTNDVPARTPADCARKCHETKGCTTAGFIPTPSVEIANGVCLLTSDDEVCISREDAVPQHASVTAFVISCIRCTRCSYTLSHMTLSSSTAKFQHIATVNTIGECAEVCNDKRCVFAQYDATTNTCALSMEASHENGCHKVEPPLAVKGAYPVRLECVQCRE